MSDITQSLMEAWQFRHACKTFDPSYNIAEKDFHTILEAGRLSPSSFGFEPWQFLVIQNRALREELKTHCWGAQGQILSCSHFLIMLARKGIAMNPYGEYVRHIMRDVQLLSDDVAEQRAQFFTKFIESDLAYAGNDRAKFEWAARQCYIALGNMMTTAALLGIDSCPIEGFVKGEVEVLLSGKDLLDMENMGVACMVAFGKREHAPKHEKTRRALDDVVQWVK